MSPKSRHIVGVDILERRGETERSNAVSLKDEEGKMRKSVNPGYGIHCLRTLDAELVGSLAQKDVPHRKAQAVKILPALQRTAATRGPELGQLRTVDSIHSSTSLY